MRPSLFPGTKWEDLEPEPLISTSIRLPELVMTRVRERAAEAGVPYTVLIRQWVEARLDDEQPVVAVADLQQFILSHARTP